MEVTPRRHDRHRGETIRRKNAVAIRLDREIGLSGFAVLERKSFEGFEFFGRERADAPKFEGLSPGLGPFDRRRIRTQMSDIERCRQVAFIRTRLQADVSSGLLQAPNANTLYVVYVQPDVAVNLGGGQGTTQQGILGYHTAFVGANGAAILSASQTPARIYAPEVRHR